jgi:glycosyltransferase involved in cell wall biosynthesis
LKAVHDWGWDSLCYRFPGVENPLAISKYSWSKQFSGSFDKWFFPAFKNVDVALAAADQNAIQGLLERADGLIGNEQIKQFPTRVNTLHFHPGSCDDLRETLGVPEGYKLIVTSGRLHWVKGWSFLLDSFKAYHVKEPRSKLVFVGDGCDRQELENQAKELGIRDSVQVTGYQQPADVAEYLRAADLFVLGSEKEGWCTSLLEALACGKPIVSTDVSSARDIVKDGVNGFVVRHRDPLSFADAMVKAQCLSDFCAFTEKEIHKYALSNLATDLANHWSVLKPENCRAV